jgi:hypothetical protein
LAGLAGDFGSGLGLVADVTDVTVAGLGFTPAETFGLAALGVGVAGGDLLAPDVDFAGLVLPLSTMRPYLPSRSR